MIILQVIFWISIFLILYSYVLFPALLQVLARGKSPGEERFSPDELPHVSVLIAAFNEQETIERKIESTLNGTYPADRLEILVGSDASTDGTNRILEKLKQQESRIRLFFFNRRTGKPGVINRLAGESRGEILVITDANVIPDSQALAAMVGIFKNPEVGLVDSRMIHTRVRKDGISLQERFYISREVKIKHHESLIWGTMMGPFGGCYAVRKSLYRPVPDNFLVDDFFINMTVLKQGFRCISNMDAKVYEDVSNSLGEEFRRKKRISAGNFQNLARFGLLLFSPMPGVAFCFFSHKVIRWLVPFLVMLSLGASIGLAKDSTFYLILLLLQLLVLLLPLIDLFLRKIKIHSLTLRFISHFVVMNIALLAGFFRYIGGIQNNVWQPTKRNQV
ncbi:MAG TPA: glycosyltransferase [Bacteroides sp.]|nr:glycosyltransferase [Bacteroides sp.]